MLVCLFAFVAVQLVVAVWAARRVSTEDDFLVAGRRLGPAMAAVSVFATWFGAESCVGAAGAAYEEGARLDAPEPFAYGVCLIVSGLVFAAPLWRRRLTTIADFFARRFGAGTERLAALLLLPSSLLWAAAQVRAFGEVVHVNSDGLVGVDLAIAIAAVVAIVYTVTGGLLADVYTDFLQCGVLVVGLVALLVAVLWQLPEVGAVEPALPSAASTAAAGSWLTRIEAWAVPICGSVVAQEVLSRTFAARSATIARRAAIGGGVAYLIVGSIPLVLGALGPRFLPGLDDPETILPRLSRELLPTAGNLLFAGALIAAILSTIDSCLLVVGSLVARNLDFGRGGRGVARGDRLWLARASIVAGGGVAWWLASSGQPVAELVEEASGFGSAGVFVLACFGLFTKFGTGFGANLALLAGLVAWVLGRHVFVEGVEHPYLLSLAASVVAFAVGGALTSLRRA